MTIHTVQKGDTINSIADQYNIPFTRLMRDNNLTLDENLSTGRHLMITYPEKTHTVQQGDTIDSVLAAYGISRIELIRNNPHLADNGSLIPGDELAISYHKNQKIKVNGFANVFINQNILIKSLPFLTYITILNYRLQEDGSLMDIADADIIKTAKQYGVSPVMFISALDQYGAGGYGTIHKLMNDQEMQNNFIQNVAGMASSKGYDGIYLGFQNVLSDDLHLYVDFIKSVSTTMNGLGYKVFVSLIPSTFGYTPGQPNTNPYFAEIGEAVDYVTLITYQWTTSYISQFRETTPAYLKEYLDFVITQIPPEKIFLSYSRIAYDWELPYVEGVTQGRFLTNEGAISLAEQVTADIQYDEVSQAPYYYYNSLAGVQHFVWFKDTMTLNQILNLIGDYGLAGVAIWNIMYYNEPTFLTISTQYNIESVSQPTGLS